MEDEKMPRYNYTIQVPERIDRVVVWPILLYRRRRYGYTFRKVWLTQGKFAKVSPCDFERISQYKWRAQKTVRSYNAVRVKTVKNKSIAIYMHREILRPCDGLMVDHINHDGLDNRRENLRLASAAENNCNRRGPLGKSSRYKGVTRTKRGKPWRATITVGKRRIHLGRYDSEIEAARAYDAAARKYHGEFACLNMDE